MEGGRVRCNNFIFPLNQVLLSKKQLDLLFDVAESSQVLEHHVLSSPLLDLAGIPYTEQVLAVVEQAFNDARMSYNMALLTQDDAPAEAKKLYHWLTHTAERRAQYVAAHYVYDSYSVSYKPVPMLPCLSFFELKIKPATMALQFYRQVYASPILSQSAKETLFIMSCRAVSARKDRTSLSIASSNAVEYPKNNKLKKAHRQPWPHLAMYLMIFDMITRFKMHVRNTYIVVRRNNPNRRAVKRAKFTNKHGEAHVFNAASLHVFFNDWIFENFKDSESVGLLMTDNATNPKSARSIMDKYVGHLLYRIFENLKPTDDDEPYTQFLLEFQTICAPPEYVDPLEKLFSAWDADEKQSC